MELIFAIILVALAAVYLITRKKAPVKTETREVISAPYKVPEPAATTPIPLVVEEAPAPAVVEETPVKKPRKPRAPKVVAETKPAKVAKPKAAPKAKAPAVKKPRAPRSKKV